MTDARTAIDDRFVPRRRAQVDQVRLDGGTVVHRDGRLHLLSPVAALVWNCCDGEVTVAEIGVELAAVFETDSPTVRRDVLAAVRELAVAGLLDDRRDDDRRDDDRRHDKGRHDGAVLLVDPDESCASCVEEPGRGRCRTYRVGRYLVGVATDDARADDAVRRALAAHLVRDGDAPAYYALSTHQPGATPTARGLYALTRGATVAVQSRRPGRVLDALLLHLASHADLAVAGLARFEGLVVAHDGRAVIVPRPIDQVAAARRLARRGLLVADLGVAIVDAATAEVVVGAPGLLVARHPLDKLASELAELGPEPGTLPWGRYRLVAMGVPGPPTPASALLTFGPRADDPEPEEPVLDALLVLLERVPVVPAGNADDLAALLGASAPEDEMPDGARSAYSTSPDSG